MTAVDRLLRAWRIRKALALIPDGCSLLDIGCGDGALLRAVAGRVANAVGIDPAVPSSTLAANVRIVGGRFPDDLPAAPASFDVITMVAVFEHFPAARRPEVAERCAALLRRGGKVVLTVPAAAVDRILEVLAMARVIDGMALEEHHGFDAAETVPLFAGAGLACARHRRFQLGLNNLYVFSRPGAGAVDELDHVPDDQGIDVAERKRAVVKRVVDQPGLAP
jgi:2-polyprenyl-3-methyl-5-hydroxy-6-metoxy-1,4-benzoquinol methylase